jgi:Flp pilus assembly protein protease CpaA
MIITGFEKYYFLFALALVWIVFAVVQDIKKREVANWLTFSLIAFALAYRAFYSSYASDWMFFVYGVFGFGLFFVLGNLFYYSGIFAGGDAKLLFGLGVILPFEGYLSFVSVGWGFVLLLFLIGAIYSLIYSVFLVSRNYSKFSRSFVKNLGKKSLLILMSVFAICFIVALFYSFGFNIGLLMLGVLSSFFFFGLVVYAKSLEVCMVKLVSPRKLTEGDWIMGDIKLNRGVVKKTVHGLSAEDIAKLRKAGKMVLIKEGIPFTPAFLLAFLITVLFFLVLKVDWFYFLF